MDGQDETTDAESLDEVIAEIEDKLATLDERRADLQRKIEVKRARVAEINESLSNLDEIDASVDEPSDI